MICETINKHLVARLRAAACIIAISTLLPVVPANGQHIHQLSNTGSSWTDQSLNGVIAQWYTGIEAFVTTPNDQTHVYYLSSLDTCHVHQLFYNGSGWSDEDLTAETGAVPALAGSSIGGFSVGNFQYVYYVGEESDVHQLLYNNSRWVDTDLSTLAGGPNALNLVALTTSPALHVYYTDNNANVRQLFSPDGSTWQDEDLSAITGGTTAQGVWMAGFNIGNFQYLYFVAPNDHVHQFLYNNSVWSDQDLTAVTNTLPASGGVQALVVPGTKQLRVFLQATNSHILQLSSPNGTTWSSIDLTKKAKAPLANSGDQIAAFATPDKALHTFYVGYVNEGENVEHIYGISQTSASTWAYQDVTALGGGGNPAVDHASLTGFSLAKDQYLFYVTLP